MAKAVVMPKLGLTMTEGRIEKWFIGEGEAVAAGDKLFEVTTDKLTNEVEAAESGILRKILVPAGESAECLKPIAVIGAADEDISEFVGGAAAPAAEEAPAAAAEKPAEKAPEKAVGGRVLASPAAKKLAAEKGIDLSDVEGTGPKGRITEEDVERYAAQPKTKASPMAEKIAEKNGVALDSVAHDGGRVMKQDVMNHIAASDAQNKAQTQEERVAMSPMRRVISQRMLQSWTASPAVTYDIGVDITNLKALKGSFGDVKITYTDFLVKILSKVLLEFPLLNCSIDGNELVYKHYVNIGVAVAVDSGLLVPVIKDAHIKGLAAISSEIKSMAADARSNALTPDKLSGGTFTVTNLGMYGIESFSPIINQPEVAILGVNAIKEELSLKNGEVVAVPMLKLSLTADHRAVDGAVAAEFLRKLKQYAENPYQLLL
jgi:pyruvate dehydrogenase E2 component (dihydrolipoamide acetyltransferase)